MFYNRIWVRCWHSDNASPSPNLHSPGCGYVGVSAVGLAHHHSALVNIASSTRSSSKDKMVITRWKAIFFNRYLTASFPNVPRPSYLLRSWPAAQARWSSATTEPRQSDADGGTIGRPSPQSRIKYTSESYAFLAIWLHFR